MATAVTTATVHQNFGLNVPITNQLFFHVPYLNFSHWTRVDLAPDAGQVDNGTDLGRYAKTLLHKN